MRINNIKTFVSTACKFYILDPIPLELKFSLLILQGKIWQQQKQLNY